jgi:hypothetical protein
MTATTVAAQVTSEARREDGRMKMVTLAKLDPCPDSIVSICKSFSAEGIGKLWLQFKRASDGGSSRFRDP